MAADKTVTYAVKVKGESNAGETASSVEKLQKQLQSSQDAVKRYGMALKNLQGNTEQVKAAVERLKAARAVEKDKITQSTLALVGHNAALVQAKARKLEAGDASKSMASSIGLATAAWNAALEAAKAFAVGVIDATFSIVKFIFESANALRTMSLFREASMQGAANAKAFGHQIDELAGKVPQTRAQLNELGVTMARSMAGTRVSGQGVVDTFNAVAQASAAMGDTAGAKLQEIIERSKTFGRLGIGLFELQGTGVSFQDVAGQLAKDLGIGINQAQLMLRQGRVKVNDGAKALREVVEKQFSGINSRRMLDLNVIASKFKDTLMGLTEDIDFTVLASSITKITAMFDKNSDTGIAMKGILKDIAGVIGTTFEASVPLIKTFIEEFTLGMLRIELAGYKAVNFLRDKFGIDITKVFDDVSLATNSAQIAFVLLGTTLGGIAVSAVIVGGAIWAINKAINAIAASIPWVRNEFAKADWPGVGKAIIQGLVGGLTGNSVELFHAVAKLSSGIRDKFKSALGIHSPSKVFEEYGKQTTAGYAKGVDGSRDQANAAVGGMVAAPRVNVQGGGGGGNTVTLNVNVTVDGGGANGEAAAKALTSPSFRAEMTRALQTMIINAGLSPQTPVGG